MKPEVLKEKLREALWQVVDRHAAVLSATLTGSFVDNPSLEGISDIDFVLVLDEINAPRFDALHADFATTLTPILRDAGFRLHINATLGPLKFNEPDLAVLHLMLYSHQGHVDHVVQSPFTCLDWQRSSHYRKQSLADVYPVFALQPRHFLGSRRSLSDYLRDFRDNTVSYRELICNEVGYQEAKRGKPMTLRDRHEFAYHVIRFLMRNLLKLVHRQHEVPSGAAMMEAFFELFPERQTAITDFFTKLTIKKRALDFRDPIANLDTELEAFLAVYEQQFREAFFTEASRHLIFRHAETPSNRSSDGQVRFLGRSNPGIGPVASSAWDQLSEQAAELQPTAIYSSPLMRCVESLGKIGLTPTQHDDRLLEIDYGAVEGLTIAEARQQHPSLFAAWAQGEDAPFPGGENSTMVLHRIKSFIADHWGRAKGDTITCTHNVVLRCLVGEVMGVPMSDWHRLRIGHLAPITFVHTKRFGLFIDLHDAVERDIFQHYATKAG